MKKTLLLSLSASLTLSACSGLTGLKDARSDFACSVESEPFCGSLSAVHEAIDRESTVTIRESVTTDGTVPDRLAIETPLMTPKRAPEEILRLWIALTSIAKATCMPNMSFSLPSGTPAGLPKHSKPKVKAARGF